MIKAVIFDMYETLATHFESPLYMAKQICADAKISEQKFREIWDTTDDARTLGQSSLEEVIEEILKANDRYSPELYELIINKRKASKFEVFNHIHPEILPLFRTLKERSIKIGLTTNCYFEERDPIKRCVLFNYFDAVCMSCELGIKKPDIRIYEKCMEELQVKPDECIYVGDGGSFELEAARKVGMHPLQATWFIKEINHLSKRNDNFTPIANPMEVLFEIDKYN